MKPAGSIAMAIGVGYLLGRKHKLRSAMLASGAVAAVRLARGPAGRLIGAAKDDASSGEPGMLAKLGGAGKAAARAALTKPVEQLGNRLEESAEAIRQGGQPGQRPDGDEPPGKSDPEPAVLSYSKNSQG